MSRVHETNADEVSISDLTVPVHHPGMRRSHVKSRALLALRQAAPLRKLRPLRRTSSEQHLIAPSCPGCADCYIDCCRAQRRTGKGIATDNFFGRREFVSDEKSKQKGKTRERDSRERDSTSPELLPEASSRTRPHHPRRSKARGDVSRTSGVISDSDSDSHPDPKLWEGRLMPEEET